MDVKMQVVMSDFAYNLALKTGEELDPINLCRGRLIEFTV